MKIYLAAPLFTVAERMFNKALALELEGLGYEVFLPQEDVNNDSESEQIFEECLDNVRESDVVLAVLDGLQADAGVCVEMAIAYECGKTVIGLRTDFRPGAEGDSGVNIMVGGICDDVLNWAEFDLNLEDVVKGVSGYLKEYGK